MAVSLFDSSSHGIANLLFQPNVIACAAIQLTCAKLKVELPQNPLWYLVFDVEQAALEACVQEMGHVYQILFDLALPLVPSELKVFVDAIKDCKDLPLQSPGLAKRRR